MICSINGIATSLGVQVVMDCEVYRDAERVGKVGVGGQRQVADEYPFHVAKTPLGRDGAVVRQEFILEHGATCWLEFFTCCVLR